MVSFRGLLQRLTQHEVEFVVIGGVAAHLLGSPMATVDVDVCAPLDDANLARIIESLRGLHPTWRFRPDRKLPVDSIEQFRGFKNLYISTDIGILDVLGELPGVGTFNQIRGKTTRINFEDFGFDVLDIDTLIASKRAAGRTKDLVGIDHLEAVKKSYGSKPQTPPRLPE